VTSLRGKDGWRRCGPAKAPTPPFAILRSPHLTARRSAGMARCPNSSHDKPLQPAVTGLTDGGAVDGPTGSGFPCSLHSLLRTVMAACSAGQGAAILRLPSAVVTTTR
jgi:hypothetical protein